MLLGITADCSKQRLKENIAFMDFLFEEFLLDTLTLMIIFHGVEMEIFHNNREVP